MCEGLGELTVTLRCQDEATILSGSGKGITGSISKGCLVLVRQRWENIQVLHAKSSPGQDMGCLGCRVYMEMGDRTDVRAVMWSALVIGPSSSCDR